MAVLRWADAVDIGEGRGRLARDPAASLLRVDAALGRPADINEAWRSPEDADANYAAYLRYLAGGPWAPIALPGDQSVHCMGYALDTDDTADWQIAIWNDHGWYWTVYRNGRLAERWHLEYFPNRDNHRGQGTSTTNGQTATNQSWEDDMLALGITDERGTVHYATLGLGVFRHLIEADDPNRMKNIVTSDDQWTWVGIDELPRLLHTYGIEKKDIYRVDNGQFVVLNSADGVVRAGGMFRQR